MVHVMKGKETIFLYLLEVEVYIPGDIDVER